MGILNKDHAAPFWLLEGKQSHSVSGDSADGQDLGPLP